MVHFVVLTAVYKSTSPARYRDLDLVEVVKDAGKRVYGAYLEEQVSRELRKLGYAYPGY